MLIYLRIILSTYVDLLSFQLSFKYLSGLHFHNCCHTIAYHAKNTWTMINFTCNLA